MCTRSDDPSTSVASCCGSDSREMVDRKMDIVTREAGVRQVEVCPWISGVVIKSD